MITKFLYSRLKINTLIDEFISSAMSEVKNMDLLVKVKAVKGYCPTYKVGDFFTLKKGYQLVSDIPVCMHGLASLMPHYNALRVSQPEEWGLAGKKEKDKAKAYIQCLDPVDYTGGGTVTFEISKIS